MAYIDLLEDLLDVTKQETTARFDNAAAYRTDESITNWESMYRLEGVIKKEFLILLQKVI